ncbi:WXG100 family type VII secretion target [Cellulomonas chitinilytica]|uniref:WXG100 family type VII secretion target n=1 Tax=Cellulomonas chitinilytica TaxID=398759 RepID=UPI0019431CC8|nr:WXG100 family type VII secretion target [Cellulomonas chitinilytica]
MRAWRPEVLDDVADGLSSSLDGFEQRLSDALRAADDATQTWRGPASDAAHTRALAENRMGRRIVAATDAAITALRTAAKDLRSVRDHAVGRVDDARAEGFSVSDEWQVTDQGSAVSSTARTVLPAAEVARLDAARRARLAHHVDVVAEALRQLGDADHRASFAVDGALDELRSTGKDVAAGVDYAPPTSLTGLTPAQVDALLRDPAFVAWTAGHPDAAKRLLDGAVDAGLLAPTDPRYSTFLDGFWQREALEAAGIDVDAWDPSKGTAANAAIIEQVYTYYGRLFLDHPELQWAGMANMIGPSFAGGFYDLGMLRDIARRVQEAGGELPDIPFTGTDDELRRAIDGLADMGDDELKFFESTFLSMQKEIFLDQGAMHEAYLVGGTAEIDRMQAAGLLDRTTDLAWHDIADGVAHDDPALVSAGNGSLLRREQWDIIRDDYDTMRSHPGTGELFTYAATLVGAPSIPGAHTFAEEFPVVVDLGEVPVTGTSLGEVVTPLPAGNVAIAEDRWKLVQEDTLPAYQHLLATDPQGARDLVASDFGDRLDDQRLASRADEIVDHLVRDWDYRR